MGNAFIFTQKRLMSTLNIQPSQSVMRDFAHCSLWSKQLTFNPDSCITWTLAYGETPFWRANHCISPPQMK